MVCVRTGLLNMPGARGLKRQRRDSNAAAEPPSEAATAGDTGARRLFRRAKKKQGAASSEDVLSADAAAKMAERKAQRENLRALRERKLSEVDPETSPPVATAPRSSDVAGNPCRFTPPHQARGKDFTGITSLQTSAG